MLHPGWGANIESIVRIYRIAEQQGRPGPMCDLFDDAARRDPTLRGLVRSRRAALCSAPVSIRPGGQDDESIRAAEIFNSVWSDLPTQRLIRHHQHSKNFYGWAGTEIEWEWRPDEKRYDPVAFYHPRSRTFRIATEHNPIVPGAMPDELLVRTGKYEHDVARAIPGKWIFTRADDDDRVSTVGLMYACAFYGLFKTQGFGEWFLFVKRYGLPFLKVLIHDWADSAAHAAADDVIQKFGEDGGLKAPKNSMLDIEVIDGAQGSRNANGDLHQRIVGDCNSEMAKLWSGGALTSEVGRTGSYAQAREHGNVRYELTVEDYQQIAESFREQMIRPWMRFNAIPGEAPHIKIHLQRVSDPAEAVDLAVKLDGIGYRVDSAQLSELTGLRISEKPAEEADDDENEESDDE